MTETIRRISGVLTAVVAIACGSEFPPSEKLNPRCRGCDQDCLNFGMSLASRDGTLVVGAPLSDIDPNIYPSSAYVYELDSESQWVKQAQLTPSDGTIENVDEFGAAVAVAEDVVFIGAPQSWRNAEPGKVYVFERGNGTWNETGQLAAGDSVGRDAFGWALAADDLHLAVGAPDRADESGGAVYVYERQAAQWELVAMVQPDDARTDDSFGSSVALSRDVLAVGAARAHDSEEQVTGAAYLFELQAGEWVQSAKFTPPSCDPVPQGPCGYRYGSSIAIDDGRLAVGAPGLRVEGSTGAGVIFAYFRSGGSWGEEMLHDSLEASAASFLAHDFGAAVAVTPSSLVAGVPGAGRALEYELDEDGFWHQRQVLGVEELYSTDLFGASVAVSAGAVFVGAPHDAEGAVYVFE